MSIPEVIDCIRIDSELHVQPFFKGAPIPLSQWFCHGRDKKNRFSRKNMLKNFLAFLQSRKELHSSYFNNYTNIDLKQNNLFSKYYTVGITP